jgi:hypothetical protein
VTATWEVKSAALDAYSSQIAPSAAALRAEAAPPEAGTEPPTRVASREFRLAVEGRARHFGQLVGCALGEPFWSPIPLAVRDPWELLPTGLR